MEKNLLLTWRGGNRYYFPPIGGKKTDGTRSLVCRIYDSRIRNLWMRPASASVTRTAAAYGTASLRFTEPGSFFYIAQHCAKTNFQRPPTPPTPPTTRGRRRLQSALSAAAGPWPRARAAATGAAAAAAATKERWKWKGQKSR